MPISLSTRSDLTLEAFRQVAWERDSVELSAGALDAITAARGAFMALVEDPSVSVYGVTSGFGDRAALTLSPEERLEQAREATDCGLSFGEPLPERVTRGIVFARLANMLEGHAAVRPEVALAVAAQLDGRALADVPARGNGGSGEILALGHLFRPLIASIELAEKEGLALVNGSPCAAALIADGALAAGGRLALAYDAFALSVEAFRAPLEAYDEVLEELWDDPCETRALQALRERIAGGEPVRTSYQAPVSFRILPRVLGQAERSAEAARAAARRSLASITDNPVFLPPTPDAPRGRALSTGGYHNAVAPSALNALAATWADLARMAERHLEQLWVGPGKRQPKPLEELLSLLSMVIAGYAEEAAAAAQPTLLVRSGPGQNDVGAPSFVAWRRASEAGLMLDACLAILLTASVRLLIAESRTPPPALRTRFDQIAARDPSIGRPSGERLSELAAALTAEIHA